MQGFVWFGWLEVSLLTVGMEGRDFPPRSGYYKVKDSKIVRPATAEEIAILKTLPDDEDDEGATVGLQEGVTVCLDCNEQEEGA
jgi:hypothetical protein